MTGPQGEWHYPERRLVRICAEEQWGQCPAGPSWHAVPVPRDGFTVKASRSHFSPRTAFGGCRRSVRIPEMQRVRGRLVTRPWPELTEFFLDMALARDGDGQMNSYCMDCFTPADPRRVLGAVAERFTLRADSGGVELGFGLVGCEEQANSGLTEGDFDHAGLSAVPFRFGEAAIAVDGEQVTSAEELLLVVVNGIAEGPNRGGRLAYLAAGQRTVTVTLRKLANASRFSEAIRAGTSFALTAEFPHPDGHSLSLSLPVLYPEASAEEAIPGRLVRATTRSGATAGESGDDLTYSLQLID